jgi:hypothetical protein
MWMCGFFHQGVRAVLAALIVIVVVPDPVSGVSGIEHETSASADATEQENWTGPLKLFCVFSVTVAVPDVPFSNVRDPGLTAI